MNIGYEGLETEVVAENEEGGLVVQTRGTDVSEKKYVRRPLTKKREGRRRPGDAKVSGQFAPQAETLGYSEPQDEEESQAQDGAPEQNALPQLRMVWRLQAPRVSIPT